MSSSSSGGKGSPGAKRSAGPPLIHTASFRALKEVFDEFDLDSNGAVDRGEFVSAIEGQAPHLRNNRHLVSVFTKLDRNKDKQLSFSELVMTIYPSTSKSLLRRFLVNQKGHKERKQLTAALVEMKLEECKSLFEIYDTDHNGVLSLAEFKTAMGQAFTLEETHEIFQKVDADGDAEISYEEFRDWYDGGQQKRDECPPSTGAACPEVSAFAEDFLDDNNPGSAAAQMAKRMATEFKLSGVIKDSAYRNFKHGKAAAILH